MRIIYLILVIVFALFIVTFSQQNLTPVQLKYYNLLDIPPVPTYFLIFVSLLIGVIITGFWGIVERFRLNRTIRRLNKIVRDLRKELHANDAPPMIDESKIPK
ncbi:MAG: LapA family protein [Deltaproteobacteria bacterium]|nr:LapA family protein [Deltaproteobacteria bacterium]